MGWLLKGFGGNRKERVSKEKDAPARNRQLERFNSWLQGKAKGAPYIYTKMALGIVVCLGWVGCMVILVGIFFHHTSHFGDIGRMEMPLVVKPGKRSRGQSPSPASIE